MIDFLTSPFIFGEFNHGVSVVSSLYGIATYLCYIIGCYMMFGFTKSISITWYYHQSAKHDFLWAHNMCWVFQAFMFASAASIFLIAQNVLYFIVGVSFFLMATFPSVLYKNFIVFHCIFASIAFVLMMVGLPLCYGWGYSIFVAADIIAVVLIALFCKQRPYDWDGTNDDTTRLYWIENVSIVIFMTAIVLRNVFGVELNIF